jgi:hypothetical protein
MPEEGQEGQVPERKKKKSSRKARDKMEERENLHSGVVNTIMKEKTRMLGAGMRDNRKNKMEDIEEAKE